MNVYLITATCLSLTGSAFAQTALLREGDLAPTGAPGQLIEIIGKSTVNSQGGFGVNFRSSDGTLDVSGIWGNFAPGSGALIRESMVIAGFEQLRYDIEFGLSSASTCYVTSVDVFGGASNVESVWLDGMPLGLAGDLIPGTTNTFTFFTDATLTDAGVPHFVAGIEDSAGVLVGRGLYSGASPTALYETGDMVPNMPFALSSSAIDFDYKFSPDGSQQLIEMDLDTAGTEDRAMSLNGAGLVLGGTLLREDQPIPTSVGGIAAENWDNFDFYVINNSGQYAITGDTNGATTSDEFILRNGTIWHREGDMIDGNTVVDTIEGLAQNSSNTIAYIWDVVAGADTAEALFIEENLLLMEGDAVDWDGDGVIDPAVTIEGFTGTNSLSLGDDGTVYFTADVDIAGSTLAGFFSITEGSAGTNYCAANANSTGSSARISAQGSVSVVTNNFSLVCNSMPSFSFGFFIVSSQQGFVANPAGSEGNLCIGGAIGRYQAQISNSGAAGAISLLTDLTALPQPNGSVVVLPGDTWNFQAWFRDQAASGMSSSNLSDGLEVVFN